MIHLWKKIDCNMLEMFLRNEVQEIPRMPTGIIVLLGFYIAANSFGMNSLEYFEHISFEYDSIQSSSSEPLQISWNLLLIVV